MKRSELRALLKLDRDEFESLWSDFALNSAHSEQTIVRDFLSYLKEKKFITETEFHKIKSEQAIEITDELIFDSDGPIPGIDLQTLLGEGAMGEVFLARDIALQRNVALKRIKGEVDAEAQTLFVKEALITAQLEHPSIVPIYSALKSAETGIAYTMKLVRGKELSDIIKQGQDAFNLDQKAEVIPLNERLEIFLKICDAIAYAHARNVIHRDLKPENIMLGPFGEVYVMDWGIAHHLEASLIEGDVLGTMGYMSPEQAQGESEKMSPKSDQYSLGLMLQELVTFRKGIPPGLPEDVFRRARRGQTAPVIHFSPKIAIRPELVAIIEKSTENGLVERYSTVDAFAEDIRRFLREDPVQAWPDPMSAKLKRWLYHHQTLAISIMAILIIIALMSNLYHLHAQQQSNQIRLQEEAEQQVQQREKEENVRVQNERYKNILLALNNEVTKQSERIDRAFLTYLSGLHALATAGEIALRSPPVESILYQDAAFLDEGLAPKDLMIAPHYSKTGNKRLSFEHSVFKIAPNVETSDVLSQMYQLNTLHPVFKNTVIRSVDPDLLKKSTEEQRNIVLVEGAPIVWAFVATEKGVHCAFPGKGGYPDDYEPRDRPWYKLAKGHVGAQCGEPYEDEMGQGLLIPCSQSLYDKSGVRVGVAGIDFSFQFVEGLLALPSFQTEDIFLVDGEGNILIHADQEKDISKRKTFPMERVVQDIRQGKSSSIIEWTAQGEHMIMYQKIDSLGWYYVVVGLTHRLFPSK
jgi:serine/threonine protein kinase